jgi:hypothetical protein
LECDYNVFGEYKVPLMLLTDLSSFNGPCEKRAKKPGSKDGYDKEAAAVEICGFGV